MLIIILMSLSCSKNSNQVIENTRNKIENALYLSYDQMAFYPNPMGKVDTLKAKVEISKTNRISTDFDFLIRSENMTEMRIKGDFKAIFLKDSLIKYFLKNDKDQEKKHIEQNRNIKYSPVPLIRNKSWEFKMDTVIDSRHHMDYYMVEKDTSINGNSIYTELHLFIDPKIELPQFMERRNFYNGQLAQSVIFEYSDFQIITSNKLIDEQLPTGYRSMPFGEKMDKIHFEAGKKVPGFRSKDFYGRSFQFNDYSDRKILMVFSIINCGYCELALEHLRKKDYKLSDNVLGIYVNPLDSKQAIIDYVLEKNIPFPALEEGQQISDLFGVAGFPTFFVIDEGGVVQQVQLGYNKDFMDSL